MTKDPCKLMLAGESVSLLPERAIYWQRQDTLFVADLHLGKGETMQRGFGASSTTQNDLKRLTRILNDTGAKRLIVLGDLLHATATIPYTVVSAFVAWRRNHPNLEMILVRGNHDRATGDPPANWGFAVTDPGVVMRPFVLHHEPPEDKIDAGYALCGHIHPALKLNATAPLPCYWFRTRRGILPAFGSFTGYRDVHAKKNHHLYVITNGAVLPTQ